MDRYQFEDLISDYLENQLDLKQRKEFESYMNSNPDAKNQVEQIRKMIKEVSTMNIVETSSDFMGNLQNRLRYESVKKVSAKPTQRRKIFGFEPMYATIAAFTFAGILFVSSQLLFNSNSPVNNAPLGSTFGNTPVLNGTNGNLNNDRFLAGNQEKDESEAENDSIRELSPDLQNRIQYVKNPR